MKNFFFGVAALCSAGAAGAQAVDAGSGDWTSLPAAQQQGRYYLSQATMTQIEELGRRGECQVRGLGRSSVDLEVPFVVRFNAQGQVERIVVRDIGCPQLETVLGSAARQLAVAGEYRPTRGAGWYRGTIQYANR